MGKTNLTVAQQIHNTMVAFYRSEQKIQWRVSEMMNHLNNSIHNGGTKRFTRASIDQAYAVGLTEGRYTRIERGVYALTKHLEDATNPDNEDSKGGEVELSIPEIVQGEIVDPETNDLIAISQKMDGIFQLLSDVMGQIKGGNNPDTLSAIYDRVNGVEGIIKVVKDELRNHHTVSSSAGENFEKVFEEFKKTVGFVIDRQADNVDGALKSFDSRFYSMLVEISDKLGRLSLDNRALIDAWREGYKEGRKDYAEEAEAQYTKQQEALNNHPLVKLLQRGKD